MPDRFSGPQRGREDPQQRAGGRGVPVSWAVSMGQVNPVFPDQRMSISGPSIQEIKAGASSAVKSRISIM